MSGVNRSTNIKSDAQVATNKKSDSILHTESFSPENGAPNSNFFKLPESSETSRARKLIFGLQVNIDKANSRRYHVIRYMVYRGPAVPRPLILDFTTPCLSLKSFQQISSHTA